MGFKLNPFTGKFDQVGVSGPLPPSSTDNALALWDGTTGDTLQNQAFVTIEPTTGKITSTAGGAAFTLGASDSLALTSTGGSVPLLGLTAITSAAVTTQSSLYILTADVDGASAYNLSFSKTAAGTSGFKSSGFTAGMVGAAGDTSHTYATYECRDFTSGGGASTAIGFLVGASYDHALVAESGSIILGTVASPNSTFNADGSVDLGGQAIIDVDSTEALLVREDGDAGDVFTVDTTNRIVRVQDQLSFEGSGVAGDATLHAIHKTTDATPRTAYNVPAGSIHEFCIGGVTEVLITGTGILADLIKNPSSANNSLFKLQAGGMLIERNKTTLTALTVHQKHASATGNICDFSHASSVKASIDITGGLTTSGGRVAATTRVTSGPYTILSTDHVIFCDTDGGAFTANLPAGVDGQTFKIVNTGSSGNNLTLAPNGSELLKGANSNQTITDGNDLFITYESTEGWW